MCRDGMGSRGEMDPREEKEETFKKGLGREAEPEWQGLPERCVMVGEVPTGSNMH